MLNAVDSDQDAEDLIVPSVTGPILGLVVEYMVHHQGPEPDIIPKALRSTHMKDVVDDPWDAQFIDKIAGGS